LIQGAVQSDSIIARSQRSKEFCNTIGQKQKFTAFRMEVEYRNWRRLLLCRSTETMLADD